MRKPEMQQQGKAIIFSAPSGAGKTTIVKNLLKRLPELKFSVSATTRKPRGTMEQHGVDYYFLSVEEFKSHIKNHKFYEWEEVYTNLFYGTLKSEVQKIWDQGNHVVFDIDVVGGINLKKTFGHRALSIFVGVKDIGVLRKRLEGRSTENKEDLEMRIEKATKEMERSSEFDYQLINDDLNIAIEEAEQVIRKFILS